MEYAIQTMHSLKRFLHGQAVDGAYIERELGEITQYRHWEVRGFPSMDAYLRAEVGLTKALRKHVAQKLAADPAVTPLQPRGRPEKGSEKGNHITFKGTSAAYLVRRLKRDAPAIAAALARGEYPECASRRTSGRSANPAEPDCACG